MKCGSLFASLHKPNDDHARREEKNESENDHDGQDNGEDRANGIRFCAFFAGERENCQNNSAQRRGDDPNRKHKYNDEDKRV